MRLAPALASLVLAASSVTAQDARPQPAPGQPALKPVRPADAIPGQPAGGPALLPIHEAARKGEIEAIKAELAKGVSINEPVKGGQGWINGSTPLIWASRLGSPETMKFLLEQGANPNITGSDGGSALMLAMVEGDVPAKVRILLDAKADVEAINWDGDTPLIWAAVYARDPAVFDMLLKAGARRDFRKPRDGSDALAIAARRGNLVAIRTLAKAGADLEGKALGGVTPLMWACEGLEAGVPALGALLDLGADINAAAEDGTTALMMAALSGDAARVRALLERKADFRAKTTRGDTALMAAARTGDPHCILALIDAGLDPNTSNRDGVTPLILALKSSRPEGVRALVRRGADVNHKTNDGWSPLMLSRSVAMIEPLIEAGADLEARAVDREVRGWTPLMFAIYDGDYFSVRRLLNAGASVTARDAIGRLPLQIVDMRQTGRADEVRELLRAMTPAMLAPAEQGPAPR